ncbi:MAG: prephenate dehydrogenase/arogenate dehydrogenase family protein [Desulfovibrio sp.]|uniref:prephenate dehydrogenase/arogenate dehydrogenase family protein n=1 Tax=Desulfovibrio sp. 7SRBS1 TaxID=3378064 RepID=UPI003B3F9831
MSSSRISTVAVIGSKGEMGSLFMEVCREAGLDAAGLDKSMTDDDLADFIPGRDLVLLCVPMSVFPQVLRQVVPHLDGKQILADVCSVKANPVRRMLAAYKGPVVGTHPLFGGNLPAPEDRRVAVCPGNEYGRDMSPAQMESAKKSLDAVIRFMQHIGFIPFETTTREHDIALGYIQGLNFVTTVSYLSATAKQPNIDRFITPSFRRRLEAARKMLNNDAQMFEAMFETNPYSLDCVRQFRSHLNIAAGGDIDLLVQRAGWWWRDAIDGGGS